jgi:hypothetical protein
VGCDQRAEFRALLSPLAWSLCFRNWVMTSAMYSSTGAAQEGNTGRIKPGQRQIRTFTTLAIVDKSA